MDTNSINVLSEQRVRLNALLKGMQNLPKSRGTATAITAVEKGRMYIGEILFTLGKEYPYDKTKSANDAKGIQDAVDVSKVKTVLDTNEITALNIVRTILQEEIDAFVNEIFKSNIVFQLPANKFIHDCNVSEAYRGLKEGRMWAGVRLGEIRDNYNISK